MKNVDLVMLGHNIRVERVKKNYSQEQLASIAKIQINHISRIENGLTDVRFSTLVSILKALNISFEQIYNLELE